MGGEGIGEKIAATVSNPISCTSGEEKVEPSTYSLSPSQTAQAAERGHGLLFPPGAPWQPVIAALWQDAAAAGPARIGSPELVYREVARAHSSAPRGPELTQRNPHGVLSRFPL